MTKPLRSLSNGMEHLSGSVSAVSAVSDVKPAIAVGQILPSVPPVFVPVAQAVTTLILFPFNPK